MASFGSFSGTITRTSDFVQSSNEAASGCYKSITVEDENGNMVNFIAAPNTYFVDHAAVFPGDSITGYYDANAPVPLIYPPQYQAIVMAKNILGQNVKVDYFNSQLISSDGTLKLNIAPSTYMFLQNDQPFYGNPENRNLIVAYGPSTKSIPAQTTPYEIIVICQMF